ncbi:cbb3-type cytochrome oxidase assembly protein CcoS [Candidatus Shikimatogenerans silvanidophilus]|nr:cbb3-type cytochrome oxidase assembly protein CcoS [Candidatus Shikimatogenerans silvanidophilus]
MGVLIIMILSSLLLSLTFLIFFLISIKNGQWDDMETDSIRIIFED